MSKYCKMRNLRGFFFANNLGSNKDQEYLLQEELESALGCIMYLERRSPARGFGDAGVEDGEVDQAVGGHKEVGQQGGDHVQLT